MELTMKKEIIKKIFITFFITGCSNNPVYISSLSSNETSRPYHLPKGKREKKY
jgi:PBP1b-binding outer membrane lipoprotein LpoB